MSVDLTDPQITLSYEEVLRDDGLDWFLLSYLESRDKLSLFRRGAGRIQDFRESIPVEPEDVYFGFCREFVESGAQVYVLITYVPDSVSGVRRARALVHSRVVGSLLKAHTVTLSAKSLEELNTERLNDMINLSGSLIPRLIPNNRALQRSTSEPTGPHHHPKVAGGSKRAPRLREYASEHQRPTSPPSSPGDTNMMTHARTSHLLHNLGDALPPPTPPKDSKFLSSLSTSIPSKHLFYRSHARNESGGSRSNLAYLSDRIEEKDYGHSQLSPVSLVSSDGVVRRRSDPKHANLPPTPPVRMLTPEEKAHLRMEAQKRREEEERRSLEEEEAWQARIKREKAKIIRQAEAEESRRLLRIAEEKRLAAAEKARREAEAQEEEERRLNEMERRKQAAKERQLENSRRIEEELRQAARRADELAKKQDEERRRSEENRRIKLKDIQEKFKEKSVTGSVLISGNVTIQTSMSVSWKRRFFEFSGDALLFYRDAHDRTQPMDTMSFGGGRVASIKEPAEGCYEELEAIPHSFAVEFNDGDGPWCLFTDSSDDKDVLVSLISEAAGLPL
ncbi:hypothetical protein SCHPADRAFT_940502 [Schizopora paradoxa]|uniref:ADF-H domain-containing protein n=1 Tax=Schizopora paradoxa TaxID=27342 RepID=A0A0H2RUX0_9AGAM|nr:hypothetical protein SCHPADRAFT_940502 [Schizopora paradoxa]